MTGCSGAAVSSSGAARPLSSALFAVTAGMGLLGAMFALGIHDSDAAGTMTREGKADHPDEDQRLADRRP
jgi:hypothetical protein